MTNAELRVEIVCDNEAAEQLRTGVGTALPAQARFIERRNLSGDASTWVVLATIAANAIPPILDFILKSRGLSQADRVRRIKVGDIEIENPTDEDLERLRARFEPPAR